MKNLRSTLMAVTGFVLGILVGAMIPFAHAWLTSRCLPGAQDPCDAGGYAPIGLAMFLAPLLGVALAALGWRAARHLETEPAKGTPG